MTTIKTNTFDAGAGIAAGHGEPTLANTFRDVADDLAAVQPTAIASPDASDLATAITLVNEIKAALNVNAGHTVLTVKG